VRATTDAASHHGAALADNTHQEVAEAVVEPVNVGEHAHGGVVVAADGVVHAGALSFRYCMGQGCPI
jgi:hypothetical protein